MNETLKTFTPNSRMRTRVRILVAALAALAVLLAAASAHAQQGQLYEDFGVGPRDAGMGNTGAAAANDFSAVFYNPAALVRCAGFNVDLGYKGIYPDLRMKIGNRSDDKEFTNYPNTNLLLIGVSWNIVVPKLIDPKWTERVTFGLAFGLSNYYKSFTVYYDIDTPYFYRYHDRAFNLLPIYLSLGLRITDWVSVGAGLVPAPSDTFTDVTVSSHFRYPDYKFWATQGTVTRAYGKVEPVAGVLFRIPIAGRPDAASIGAIWRDEVSTSDGRGEAANTTQVHFEGNTFALPAAHTPILTLTGWTPNQAIGAAAYHPTEGSTVTAEVLWKQWSHWINFFYEHPNPRFRDTWNARFGAENIFATDNTVVRSVAARGGLYREYSPIPDQNGQSNYLDPNKWVVTAGIDTALAGKFDVFRVPVHVGVSGQAHIMDKVHYGNERDPDYPPITAWGNVYSVTATVKIGSK